MHFHPKNATTNKLIYSSRISNDASSLLPYYVLAWSNSFYALLPIYNVKLMNLTKLCKPQMVLYTSMCLLSKSFVNTSITCKELHNRVSKKIVEETIVKTLQKGMRLVLLHSIVSHWVNSLLIISQRNTNHRKWKNKSPT